jgi:hypothetical protein
MQRSGINRALTDEGAHGCLGEWQQRDTARGGRCGQNTEHGAQGMPRAQLVVPVRHHQQRCSVRNATPEEPEQIERRLVHRHSQHVSA